MSGRRRPGRDVAPPQAIAHRGASAQHPENTLSAFRAALAAGCDGIECDLRPARDGIVVSHDAHLGRFGAGVRPVALRTCADLARADVGAWKGPRFAGAGVPTLDELLTLVAGRVRLLLELKAAAGPQAARRNAALVAGTVALLGRRAAWGWCEILCFRTDLLRAVRRRAPRARLVRNAERLPVRRGPWLDALVREGIAVLSCHHPLIDADLVRSCRERGLALYAWTVDDGAEVRRLRRLGIDGLMANDVARLRERLRA